MPDVHIITRFMRRLFQVLLSVEIIGQNIWTASHSESALIKLLMSLLLFNP